MPGSTPRNEDLAIEYLIVVPVPMHREAPGRFALEGAFCEHLRMLRRMLAPPFTHMTIASPAMDSARFERDQAALARIDEEAEGIRWVALHPVQAGHLGFWARHLPRVLGTLWREVRRADLVHSGTSHNLFRPIESLALLLAVLFRKKTICVIDIDLRDEARMNVATGRWTRKNLFMCRRLYDPLRNLQLRLAAQHCSLVLLKSRGLCRDFGRGREAVKYFLDSAFSADQMIPSEALARKLSSLEEGSGRLEIVYFGRLTAYKGVDRCIQAVARAAGLSGAPIRLHIIGNGEERERLAQLAESLGVKDSVEFHGALPFGPRLFAELYPLHLLLAAPLSEDTPRSALDALACGIPILAFETAYYSDLKASGAVDLVPWPSVEHLAERIALYAQDKRLLVPMARAGVEYARRNTQETWLRSRVRWTLELFGKDLQPT